MRERVQDNISLSMRLFFTGASAVNNGTEALLASQY